MFCFFVVFFVLAMAFLDHIHASKQIIPLDFNDLMVFTLRTSFTNGKLCQHLVCTMKHICIVAGPRLLSLRPLREYAVLSL